jgi:uncharacterized protein DUF3467
MPEHVKVVKKTAAAAEVSTVQIVRNPDPSFQTIYANNVHILTSYYDLKILFGEVVSVSGETLQVTDKAAILMSLEHAAAFHRVLGEQLKAYRERFGEIRAEPGATQENQPL